MTKTIENLTKAFIGESQARNRYTIYAAQAKKEGYEQLAGIFEETANQEFEHGEWNFKMLKELLAKEGLGMPELKVEAGAPTTWGSLIENLQGAIKGENWEHTTMYPEFAEQAKKDGYPEVAKRLLSIAKAEEHHEERYLKYVKVLEDGTVFKKEKKVWWYCRKCGYMHFGEEAPTTCPSCGHAQGFYQMKCEEY
ncbi:MAG: ferritin family protein [Patescibacteria group bacterium]